MTGNGEAEAEPRQGIVIRFAGPGLADCTIDVVGNVTTGQVYAAAWLFEAWAKETRLRETVGSQSPLAIPGLDLPAFLAALKVPGGPDVG